MLLLQIHFRLRKHGTRCYFNPLLFLLPVQHPLPPGCCADACWGKHHYLWVHGSEQGWGPGWLHAANTKGLWSRRQVGVRNPVGHLVWHRRGALTVESGALLHLRHERRRVGHPAEPHALSSSERMPSCLFAEFCCHGLYENASFDLHSMAVQGTVSFERAQEGSLQPCHIHQNSKFTKIHTAQLPQSTAASDQHH